MRKPPPRTRSSTPEELSLPKAITLPAAKSKVKGFRIGGKNNKAGTEFPPTAHMEFDIAADADDLPIKKPLSSQMNDNANANANATPKKVKRTFKIGGKGKVGAAGSSQVPDTASPMTDRTRATHSPSAQPPSSPPVDKLAKEETPAVEEEHEETPEERAERRRAELKRKTEEAAKKQAQSKKKRRF